jgi:DUF1680 family protein
MNEEHMPSLLRPVAPRARVAAEPLEHSAEVSGGFWAQRQSVNATESIREGWAWLQKSGSLVNFASVAAGGGEYLGEHNQDAETFKWVEAASFEVARTADPELRVWLDEAVTVILGAQEESGYLHTWHQLHPGGLRFDGIDHGGPDETYTGGHFIHAAVAHARATGERRMLDGALRLARHLDSAYFSRDADAISGHPGIEMALVELYRQTGEHDVRELARRVVHRRGHGWLGTHRFGSSHYQDYLPVAELPVLTGHAVAGLYLMAGATDVAIETEDTALLGSLERMWESMTRTRMHLTGGIGSRPKNEDVGDDYELNPDSAYCETCASIALVMWSWRLLVATGRARYAEVVERALYNGVLVGVGRDGRTFRYDNPLQVRGGHRTPAEQLAAQRAEWFELACCPPNLMRLLASIGHYVATRSGDELTLQQLVSTRLDWGEGELAVEAGMPWSGELRLAYRGRPHRSVLRVRVPSWAEGVELAGAVADVEPGYVRLDRDWSDGDIVSGVIRFAPRWTLAHPGVDALRGAVALEVGPLVYCVEQAGSAAPVDRLAVAPADAALAAETDGRGFVALHATLRAATDDAWASPLYRTWTGSEEVVVRVDAAVRMVPYLDWGNAAPGPMRVWLPLEERHP